MLQFNLPYPPSINHYYGRRGNRTFVKPQGIAYRALILSTLWQCIGHDEKWHKSPMDGDLMVEIIIYPPDKRKRDMDNIKKALFDALQHAGLYKDDNQICDDHTIRINKVVKGGLIDFRIQKAYSGGCHCFEDDCPLNGFLEGFSI
jgi:crossover junction endodeoxyribonuclease RusA